MLTYIEQMVGMYAQHPVKVRHKVDVPPTGRLSRMVEYLREQQATQEVNNAVTRFYYGSKR